MEVSVLVPVFDEEENLRELADELIDVLRGMGRPFEIIMVDDGSKDDSVNIITRLSEQYEEIVGLQFVRNFGQTAALMAAIDHAKGNVLVPIDSDMQNDPQDIPRLLEKLDEGYDLVSGWRIDRKDKRRRVYLSRLANALISWVSGVKLHDYGCTLKAYRANVLKPAALYGEMHRFMPIYASWNGAKWTEIKTNHRPRRHGVSKYGMSRIIKVLLDLLVVMFLEKYMTKPIYFFGLFGILSILVSAISAGTAVYLKVFEGVSFIVTPLPLLSTMTFLAGLSSILAGIIAEILIRIYFEVQNRRPYLIKKVIQNIKER